MGCDCRYNTYHLLRAVSIHAPAWGATHGGGHPSGGKEFQSTHPHGVRQSGWMIYAHNGSFNPRTRMGCDLVNKYEAYHVQRFNPRTRMGCDRDHSRHNRLLRSFNPRTRMGCDLAEAIVNDLNASFNPRTRMGCDMSICFMLINGLLFQSTHPHGVRLKAFESCRAIDAVSIHAPAWGATRQILHRGERRSVSIHAPAWGATTLSAVTSSSCHVSIHAPAWGATFTSIALILVAIGFNPRTRMGCD